MEAYRAEGVLDTEGVADQARIVVLCVLVKVRVQHFEEGEVRRLWVMRALFQEL
jgi:hypothetical protein